MLQHYSKLDLKESRDGFNNTKLMKNYSLRSTLSQCT